MAKSINQVTLVGNLGKDAESSFTPSGVHVAKFSVATERSFKQGDAWKTETDWHNIVAWRMEKLSEYLVKGTKVAIIGRLQTRKYTAKDGTDRYVTEVVADTVVLCGSSQQRGYSDTDNTRAAATPAGRPLDLDPPVTDDDVPF